MALADSQIDALILLARHQARGSWPIAPFPVVVCPELGGMLTYTQTVWRNALHAAAIQYAGRVWDVNRLDPVMVQFLLEFRAWIDTPGREVTFR